MWPISIFTAKFPTMEDDYWGSKIYGKKEEGLREQVSRSQFIDVPHVRQLSNWDCGLACVLMVLKTFGIDDRSIPDLEEFCTTTSIWTVDLAYLLKRFSINFSFYTVTIGANPDYSSEAFYKEQLHDDRGRVNALFDKAPEAGIQIEHRSLSGKDISLLMLSGGYIAIALVDKYKLSYSRTTNVYLPEIYGRHLDYIGHFILICGYDGEKHEFEIRDPASSRKHERIPLRCLDEARKSFGTDEDILLISLNGQDGPKDKLRR